MRHKNILTYVQQDATLHSLFIWKLFYMFWVVPLPIIRSATQLYLQHLVFVTPLLLPAAIVEELERSIYIYILHALPWDRTQVPR